MRPVGLSLKLTCKKYGDRAGELMVVHLCSDCGATSLNRIAADDDAASLNKIYTQSCCAIESLLSAFQQGDILFLSETDSDLVGSRLSGREALTT